MNDDLQTYIDPELEARIVALMLGESSAFEAEELERLIAEKPELKAYWTSLEQLHGVVSDAFRKQDNEDWKISKDKRGKIQAKINKKKRHDMVLARRERISKVAQLKLVYACAACLVFTLSIVALKNSFKSVKNEAEVGIVTADSEAKERRLERFYYNANSRAFDAEWTAKTDEQKTDYMKLNRMGSRYPSRLSFSRSMLRRLKQCIPTYQSMHNYKDKMPIRRQLIIVVVIWQLIMHAV